MGPAELHVLLLDCVRVLVFPLADCTVVEAGACSHAVALPIAGILPIMASAFGAGIHPHCLSSGDYLCPSVVHIAVGT